MVTKEKPIVLLVDDNEIFLTQFASLLEEGQEFAVVAVSSAAKALDLINMSNKVDVVISDVQMPDMDGVELFRKIQDAHPDVPVIFITAFASVHDAAELVRKGAFHYFEKPIVDRMDLFQAVIREAIEKRGRTLELAALRRERALNAMSLVPIIGGAPAMLQAIQSMREAAEVGVTILINGETGTGKELFARSIHALGDRSDKTFFAVNCAEFAEGVLESELFGHEKGSFTGAHQSRRGLFELVHGGTLFLDEISEASNALQAKLLRVIETKTFTRVGGTSPVISDFRLITATNRNLHQMVADGQFRQDLLYRLKVFVLDIPPLRARKDDIPMLAEFYLEKFKRAYRRNVQGISMEAFLFLREYEWPGNVRELVNMIESAVITCQSEFITTRDLAIQLDMGSYVEEPHINLKGTERFVIFMALKRSKGNRMRAAELLGINRKTLADKIKLYGLEHVGL